PRFVFLRHEVPAEFPRGSHFDLMFEVDGSLRTWAVSELPTLGGLAVVATPLAPHRIAYLDYEGPVSRGRGTVRRIARGSCELLSESGGRSEFDLHSAMLRGRIIFAAGRVWIEESLDHS